MNSYLDSPMQMLFSLGREMSMVFFPITHTRTILPPFQKHKMPLTFIRDGYIFLTRYIFY